MTLNDITLTNYYKLEHQYPERVSDSTDIEIIYWTNKEGLIAYKNKGGEIWTKKAIEEIVNKGENSNISIDLTQETTYNDSIKLEKNQLTLTVLMAYMPDFTTLIGLTVLVK